MPAPLSRRTMTPVDHAEDAVKVAMDAEATAYDTWTEALTDMNTATPRAKPHAGERERRAYRAWSAKLDALESAKRILDNVRGESANKRRGE